MKIDNGTNERSLAIRPSWIFQTIIAVLLTMLGVMASTQYKMMNSQYASLNSQLVELRADFNALEKGIIGDRFTRTDANRLEIELRSYIDREVRRVEEDK